MKLKSNYKNFLVIAFFYAKTSVNRHVVTKVVAILASVDKI